ncbi:MAG: tetratricopeptide repeat protein [Saprospiraceae bacterium]|nr:tetratricopeptide repeat protein [Saprospiraceae bacterium]
MKIKIFPFFFLFQFFSFASIIGQTSYQQGWDALDKADIKQAFRHFRDASSSGVDEANAHLMLAIISDINGNEDRAKTEFEYYRKKEKNPYPAMFAFWRSDFVAGQASKLSENQLDLLKELDENETVKGKLDGAVDYYLGFHYLKSFDEKRSKKYHEQIGQLYNWSFVGPFDNVMNAGFDKDFGPLQNPEKSGSFASKYGAKVSWFDPPLNDVDGYITGRSFFPESNYLLYAQTFVDAPEAMDVLLKLGYSGVLKLWVNDQLVHAEEYALTTEMDFFTFKLQFQKGTNRILIQLGDFETSYENFCVRLTDLNHNLLEFPNQPFFKPYQKYSNVPITSTPFFAIRELEKLKEANPADPLYPYMLAKAYGRTRMHSKTEEILLEMEKDHKDNFLVIGELNILYNGMDNNTKVAYYYGRLKSLYPEAKVIMELEIKDIQDEGEKAAFLQKAERYKELYPSADQNKLYKLAIYENDGDYESLVRLIENEYRRDPSNLLWLTLKYKITKDLYNDAKGANAVLETFLDDNFDYSILITLADNLKDQGDVDEAIELLKRVIELVPSDWNAYNKLADLYIGKKEYDSAESYYLKIIKNRPSDNEVYTNLGELYQLTGKTEMAVKAYEKSINYFPFNFEDQEELRALKGQKRLFELVQKPDHMSMIEDYKKNFTTEVKKPYDIVFDHKDIFVYKNTANASIRTYILKINTEEAINDLQKWTFNNTSTEYFIVQESKAIKADGSTISAEVNGNARVFTNLEVGDYVYIRYASRQYNGGKSSPLVYDSYSINSMYPWYKSEFNVYTEDGLDIYVKNVNTDLQPEISKIEGITKRSWKVENPTIIKDEPLQMPFMDLASSIFITVTPSWQKIIDWYKDLSTYQASQDLTVSSLVKDLFEGKNLSDKEKAEAIYHFVTSSIQYSSIDFRQSNFIPQKASNVYHSRLGDCKDMSTLYAAMAREAGLDCNLVLIKTADKGKHSVTVPSPNFNHCIVKVNVDNEPIYLELTDQFLPFGYLKEYHYDAPILEIPFGNTTVKNELEYLQWNKGYKSGVKRKGTYQLDKDGNLEVEKVAVKYGVGAGDLVDTYSQLGEKEKLEVFEEAVSNDFNSQVTMKSLSFKSLEYRIDSVEYEYTFSVDNAGMKMGKFRSLKIPFSDVLAKSQAFNLEERTTPVNFITYEPYDFYFDKLTIEVDTDLELTELPQNVELSFKGIQYKLNFEQPAPNKILVNRQYQVKRQNFPVSDYKDLKTFMLKIIESEETHLLFKLKE